MDHSTLSIPELKIIKDFLSEVSETNEDTEYDQSDKNIVNSVILLVKDLHKTSIVEDFEIPYIHPMATVQKWCEELKTIVDQEISDKQYLH